MTGSIGLLLVLACGNGRLVQNGRVGVCAAGDPRLDDTGDIDLVADGTITAVGGGDCPASTVSFAMETSGGDRVTIGLSVTGADDADITPDPRLAVEQAVSLHYRDPMGFGDVAGFALAGDGGLLLAAEEGTWGSALQDGDIDGLTVSSGTEEVAREPVTCGHLVGHEVVFSGDAEVAVEPVDSAQIAIHGAEFTATAVAAYGYEDDRNCSVADRVGVMAWVVSR